jgi:hypothetical protein
VFGVAFWLYAETINLDFTFGMNKYFAKIGSWLSKKPQTKATWIMVFVSCVMTWTLIQNQRVINQNARTLQTTVQSLELQKITTSNELQQLQIEEETRLNPELECAYNPYYNNFLIRNVGTMPAENIFIQTMVFCVSSNGVFQLVPISAGTGTILPPLDKRILIPGEAGTANQIYSPDAQWVTQFWEKYGGEILVRVYVVYERTKPTYNRYSGFFNFTMNPNPGVASPYPKGYQKLFTEEEKPLIQNTLEQFNATPSDRFKIIAYFGSNEMKEIPRGIEDQGINAIYGATSNSAFIWGSWAKQH